MGITIVQKSDLAHPKPHPKIALVLAGGGVSGGAFKLGGLMALNRFMLNQKIINFDIYVGTSAGAIISAYLANGVPVSEIIASMEGTNSVLGAIRASEFYHLNYKDFFIHPARLCWDMCTLIPRNIFNFLIANNIFRENFRKSLLKILSNPTYENCEQFLKEFLIHGWQKVKHPSVPWGYIPTGIFTTEKFENTVRKSLEDNNLPNNFNELYEKTHKSLYIVATNLNTAGRTIFGHDEINTVSISKAVQASVAIPLFYKPVKIGNEDYVDGAVAKTTSIDWAFQKGADLVICYNPFRPFNHEVFCKNCEDGSKRLRIAEDGLYPVLNQVMRTVLHTRLMNNLEMRRNNPDFKGDVILIEPTEYDDKFFDMNPLVFWERQEAAKRGFESVKQSIIANYDILKKILSVYGIDTNVKFIRDQAEEPVSYLSTFYKNLLI